MQPVEVHWVAIITAIGTTVGAFLPKLSEWFSSRKKDEQSDVGFVITNLKDLTTTQSDKLTKMETRLLDMQQKLIDMQTAHVQTLVENVTMKGQIQALTAENGSLKKDLAEGLIARQVLDARIGELERRSPK